MKRILIILLLLLSLTSCDSKKYKKLYEDESYNKVYTLSSTSLAEKIDETNLYYNVLSAFALDEYSIAEDRAEIYYYLYDDKDHRNSILRIMLYISEPELAYEAANELMEDYIFTKSDSVQYYKILNQMELYTAASKYLSEIRSSFTSAEIAFAVINADAQSWQLLASLEDLYKSEGVSDNFLSAVKLAFPMIVRKEGLASVELFISKTYKNESDYALLLGDFYYSLRMKEKALSYWSEAFNAYPELVEERSKLII